MFQDGSDRRPTDSPQTLSVTACSSESLSGRGRRTLRADLTSRTTGVGARRTHRGGQRNVPRSAGGPTPQRCITPRARRVPRRDHLLSGLETASKTVVALNSPKVHPTRTRPPTCRSVRIRTRRRLNSAGRLCVPIRLLLNGFT